MESFTHRHLKRLAIRIIRESGGCAHAMEVRCPIAQFRVDAAGYFDPIPKSAPARTPGLPLSTPLRAGSLISRVRGRSQTVMFECKQCRADFLRDSRDLERLLAARREMDEQRRWLEQERICREEPHLRRSSGSLFPELDHWQFRASGNREYRSVIQELNRIDLAIHGQTKFGKIARYRLADHLYLLAPAGLVQDHECPPGWGLIEATGLPAPSSDTPSAWHVVVKCAPLEATETRRLRLLRNIAVAASRGRFTTADELIQS